VITIVGTGHIFDLKDPILRFVQQRYPDLVAVELDRRRQGILEMERRNRLGKKKEGGRRERDQIKGFSQSMRNIGSLFRPSPLPFRFRILAYVQKKLADMYNVFPGEEMLAAMDAARVVGAKIALIDRDIALTLQSLNRNMGRKERMKFYMALVSAFTGIGGKKTSLGSMIEQVENDYDALIAELGTQFPGMKKALIDERDLQMAKALYDLQNTYHSIIAFVGDAHVEGMRRILERWDVHPEVIHLNSFMKNGMTESTNSINFSIH